MNDQPPQVIAATATFGRPEEIRRLLVSLAGSQHPLHALIVIDNAGDEAVRQLVEAAPLSTLYINPGQNLGCGGGLHRAEELMLERFPEATHLWILDDDCVVFPETLGSLLGAMHQHSAAAVHPLTEDAAGQLSWIPGLVDRRLQHAAEHGQTPSSFLRAQGLSPIPFLWSQGIALLVTRKALEEQGLHRTDYWVRGEDLEFSLRLTHRSPGLYVPTAKVAHLPPAASAVPAFERKRHLAMLQNIAYTALRLPHGRRVILTLPANWWQFLRVNRFRPAAVWDAARAFWRGVIRGEAAGTSGLGR